MFCICVFTIAILCIILLQPFDIKFSFILYNFRLAELAKPKNYDPLLIKSNSSWEWGAWKSDVPKEALSHIASARLETLAEAKKLPIEYQGNRPVMWPVSDAARNTQVNNPILVFFRKFLKPP